MPKSKKSSKGKNRALAFAMLNAKKKGKKKSSDEDEY